MAQNQAVSLPSLKDLLFSEEEITKSVETREHIFEMRDENESSLGFISLYDLKSYVHDFEEDSKSFQVKNIDGSDWTPIYEHPYFQRRKPQLVSANTLSSDDEQQFFILKNGQKTGPYEKYELTSMLEEKDLLLTDMVSSNAGHTWMKLYQVDGFDRRSLKESDQLPGIPAHVIMREQENIIPISPETDAISGLAYLSNVRRGKTVEREKVETFSMEKAAPGKGSSTIYKWLLVFSVVGIGFFLFHIKEQLTSPFTKEAKSVGEQAEMLSPVDTSVPQTNPSARSQLGERNQYNQVNDQRRTGGKFETRQLNPVRPAIRKSFMESGKYQEIQGSSADENDPNYFYDNTSAMELDPVRSQVSKENYDNGGAEEGPIPSSDQLFESEINN